MHHIRLTSIVLLSTVVAAANASVTFNLNTPVNGDNPGTGLSALLQDAGANTVKLTMTNGTTSTSYIPFWLFNVNSAVGALTFTRLSGETAVSATRLTDGYIGGNQVKAGKFDIQFTYAGSGAGRLTNGESSVYKITGLGLSTASFLGLSANDVMKNGKNANVGNYFTAADVRFGNGKSGSVAAGGYTQAVPEPASMAALGVGAVGLLKRRKKA